MMIYAIIYLYAVSIYKDGGKKIKGWCCSGLPCGKVRIAQVRREGGDCCLTA